MTAPAPLLLYDGDCGLCNALVRRLLSWDKHEVLRFAPLQGRTGQEHLRRLGLDPVDFDSLVFIRDLHRPELGFSRRTRGIIELLALLGASGRIVSALLRVVPGPLRDLGYRVVARLRYRLFGEYRPTPLPNPRWAERILL
jgi:predicted DCC family thiol-disulfide oxidoreductase YuxK